MHFSPLTRSVSLYLLTAAFSVPALAADGDWSPALVVADVDLAKSSMVVKGESTLVDATLVRDHFQPILKTTQRKELKAAEGWRLTLTFAKPMVVGTSFLAACGNEREHFVAEVLPAGAQDWRAIEPTQTFAADFRAAAVRLTAKREYRGALSWLLGKTRLTSLTSTAVGSGEKAPFGSHPNSLPLGKSWVNTAKDPNPGAPKQLLRGPISAATPSWYILSWDAPQTLDALWLSANAEQYRLLAYRGQEGLNPALAPATAWARVDAQLAHELRGGNSEQLTDRLLTFSPLKTTALKLEMTDCNGAVARVGRMDALAGRAVDAPLVKKGEPGKAIPFEQPFDGQLAMVITDQEGRTIRNLVAQVDRKRGANVERWDLRDEDGRTVPPGAYRWKAITSPPIGVKYQMSVYPNAPQFFPGTTPWLTGESGPNGWLADHAPITSGATVGDRIYLGAPGVESGVCLIECDLTGKKLWAKHNFGPFSGVGRLAGDATHLYIYERDTLHRLEPSAHKLERLTTLSTPERRGDVVGMAAHNGQVVVAVNSPIPWLENATRADVVDLENSVPKFAAKIPDPLGTRRVTPMPRVDFLRLLRLTGTPAGQGAVPADKRESHFPITLDTVGEGKYQYITLAFKEPVPLGSVVLPCVGPEYLVDFSVLKPNAKYPPDSSADADWLPCEKPRPGWTCIPMPPQTRTQGLRIRVRPAKDAGEDNLIDDLLAEKKPKKKDEFDLDRPADAGAKFEAKSASNWFARFEGLKLLRRRFTDITPEAKVRVNSGEVNAAGEWDAKRTEALSAENPGVYVLEWPQAKSVTGLAIKEIDGAKTEIDIWDDASGGEIPLTDSPGWKKVATYEQSRRDSYQPAFERNDAARYLDGYVALGETKTRAVRLRVVSQWADLGDRGTNSLRVDHGGRDLDPRRCRIFGVAALAYLGDEAPLDSLSYQRLEVRDGATGKLVRELPVAAATSLTFNAKGELFGVQGGRVVKIDLNSGKTENVLPEIDGVKQSAIRIAVGADNSFHVFTDPDRVIHVYDAAGTELRTVGKPGGIQPGPWDPEKFRWVETLFVDPTGQMWVVESQDVPRRVVRYDAKGKFVREFLGNTHYGGGGVLDPADKTRLFYGPIEFAIDWDKGTSRIKNMLAEWMPENCIPIRFEKQTYLVSAPLSYNDTQPAVTIYRYDEARGQATLAAAFGEADKFDALKTPAILARLASGKVPKDYLFLWSDKNSDGKVDAAEVTFELKTTSNPIRIGRGNERLRFVAGSTLYQPKAGAGLEFEKVALKNGVAGSYEFDNGDVLALQAKSDNPDKGGDDHEARGIAPDGAVKWRYPKSHAGVSGLYLPPWSPGYVTNEFGVIGHGKPRGGELGEFVVIHGNNGMWKIWTADGLLAGQILRHKFDPKSIVDTATSKVERGQAFDNMTAGQEHFHGYFTQTADGRDYIIHGHNYIGLWEVTGLDQFKRLGGDVVVSPEDVREVRSQHEELARREAKSQARTLECLRVKNGELAEVAEMENVHFSLGYDDQFLYARWIVSNCGKLANSGVDFQRYFKTGACLDLQLGLDEKAPAGRKAPAAGDIRLLFTVANGKPQAVLYQPVAPGADPKDAWETRTDAAGTTSFDRVVRLTNANLDFAPEKTGRDSYIFTAAVPMKELNWKPRDGQMLRCDWGVLTSDDGHTVKRRMYWSNPLATGTSDEAWEARLDPHLWGSLAVMATSKAERQIESLSPDKPKTGAASDILDDILNGASPKKK